MCPIRIFQSKCRCLCWELSYELDVQSSFHSSESHVACVSLCCVKLFLQLIKWCTYLVCFYVYIVGHISELFYIFTFCLGCTKGNSDSFRIIQNNRLILILAGTIWRQKIFEHPLSCLSSLHTLAKGCPLSWLSSLHKLAEGRPLSWLSSLHTLAEGRPLSCLSSLHTLAEDCWEVFSSSSWEFHWVSAGSALRGAGVGPAWTSLPPYAICS